MVAQQMDKRTDPTFIATVQEAVSAAHTFNPVFFYFTCGTIIKIHSQTQLSSHGTIYLNLRFFKHNQPIITPTYTNSIAHGQIEIVKQHLVLVGLLPIHAIIHPLVLFANRTCNSFGIIHIFLPNKFIVHSIQGNVISNTLGFSKVIIRIVHRSHVNHIPFLAVVGRLDQGEIVKKMWVLV